MSAAGNTLSKYSGHAEELLAWNPSIRKGAPSTIRAKCWSFSTMAGIGWAAGLGAWADVSVCNASDRTASERMGFIDISFGKERIDEAGPSFSSRARMMRRSYPGG